MNVWRVKYDFVFLWQISWDHPVTERSQVQLPSCKSSAKCYKDELVWGQHSYPNSHHHYMNITHCTQTNGSVCVVSSVGPPRPQVWCLSACRLLFSHNAPLYRFDRLSVFLFSAAFSPLGEKKKQKQEERTVWVLVIVLKLCVLIYGSLLIHPSTSRTSPRSCHGFSWNNSWRNFSPPHFTCSWTPNIFKLWSFVPQRWMSSCQWSYVCVCVLNNSLFLTGLALNSPRSSKRNTLDHLHSAPRAKLQQGIWSAAVGFYQVP